MKIELTKKIFILNWGGFEEIRGEMLLISKGILVGESGVCLG